MAEAKKPQWYVAHTYSGYENKVKENIERTIENRGMQDLITDVRIPMEEVVEQKDGEQKVSLRKTYPSYVFIKMVMTDESWYVVRNTRGCTGFVGPGSKPVPLSEDEIIRMGVETKVVNIDFAVGDSVKVCGGPFDGFIGVVEEIEKDKGTARVVVSMFGRETPVDLEFSQIETLN